MMDRSLRVLRAKEVVEAEVAEEPRSFEVFFASEHARLFGALCLVTGDRSEAEEIMQDA
jgi:DNA-directed RNA polymerase specialized sigma24 family protein